MMILGGRHAFLANIYALLLLPYCVADPTEREVLRVLWETAYGAQWINSQGWNSTSDDVPICSWFGVECIDYSTGGLTTSSDSGITALRLKENNLAQYLPPSLWNYLPNLVEVDFSHNSLTNANLQGLDPSVMTSPRVAPLETLDLSNCFLTDVSGLSQFSQTLTTLRLTGNPILLFPTEIYQLPRLEILYMNGNNNNGQDGGGLKGQLSSEIGQLTNLVEFYAYANEITGSLPTEFGLLNKLQVLSLSNNQLSGSIPTEFENLINLQVLSLHGGGLEASSPEDNFVKPRPSMSLTGKVPSFANSPRLSKLFLSDNELTGSLPDNFLEHNAMSNLGVLINLQNNFLTGGIPASLRHFQSLHMNLANNRLSEPLPDFFCAKAQWMHGLVSLYGCNAILCPIGTVSAPNGQQSSDDTACQPCPITISIPSSKYFLGATVCPQSENDDNPSPPDTNPVLVDTARILLEFYLALDGPRWEQNSGWEFFDALEGSNPKSIAISSNIGFCLFHGIICNGAGEVEFVTLSNNRLHGTMPKSIFQLPKLVSLDLSFNPSLKVSDWSGLKTATSVDLARLKFSHTGVSRLTGISAGKHTLTSLFLSGIELEGSLPDELFKLTKLETLQLDAADVVGPLSTNIGALVNLRRLNLNENQFQGSLPTELNMLSNLEFLDLSDNDWTGVLPSNFLHESVNLIDLRLNGARAGLGGPLPHLSSLKSIEVCELAYNSFDGKLPSLFLEDARVTSADSTARASITIDLAGNELTGPLPLSFATFDTPLILKLQDNRISQIPDALCQKSDWMEGAVASFGCEAILCEAGSWNKYGRISGSHLCDDCPGNLYWGQTRCHDLAPVVNREREILDEFFQATGGRYWNKTNEMWEDAAAPICQREGILCSGGETADEGVSEIRLEHFGLRGSIPTSVYQLTGLRRLAVSNNPVELSFQGIDQATALEVVSASRTKTTNVSGLENVPPEFYVLHLSSCGLEGPFPEQFLSMTPIKHLKLDGNHLTGHIPRTGWENVPNLVSLELADNDLRGPLPPAMSALSSLQILDFHSNLLSGPLPPEWSEKMVSLTNLNMAEQRGIIKLTGPMLDFANASNLVDVNLRSNQMAGGLPSRLLTGVPDKEGTNISLDLSFNQFDGGIPSEWGSFDHMALYLAGNRITAVPPELCAKMGWMVALGYDMNGTSDHACNFLLCPPQTSASAGRETATEECVSCTGSSSSFYGAVDCAAESSDVGERAALIEFYQATNGDQWVHNDNWGSALNICTWYGVICRDDTSVTDIRLDNNGLTNTNDDVVIKDVIQTLAPLTGLKVLDLKGNAITLDLQSLSPISPLRSLRISKTAITSLKGVENAKQLTVLHAMDNELTGGFPLEILQCSNLTEVHLSFNNYSGSLPSEISSLSKLKELYLDTNEFSGQLPAAIGTMHELRELVLGDNHFSGTIPDEFSLMINLEQFFIEHQRGAELITGSLPDFAGAPRLWYLDVSDNDLGSNLPDTLLDGWTIFDQPLTLILRGNEFTGSIPASLSRFESIFVDLTDNQIDEIPESLCKNEWMEGDVGLLKAGCDTILCPAGYFNRQGRQFSPDSMCIKCDGEINGFMGQTKCRVVDSDRSILMALFRDTEGVNWQKKESWGQEGVPICSWEGVSCNGDAQDDDGVEKLSLQANGLRGSFPSQVWALPSLKELDLRGNFDLRVSLSGIENTAGTLEILDVSNTKLESFHGSSQATNLRELYAEQAGISGPFPKDLLKLTSLEVIHMNWNFLVGMLPSDIGSLSMLKSLHLSGNDFHGTIPSSIGFLGDLEELVLDDCLVSGELPSELSYLPRLRHLSITRTAKSGQKISGSIPAFDRVSMLESLGLEGNQLSGSIPATFLGSSVGVEEVVLDRNHLEGAIPSSLSILESLHLSVLDNEISQVSDDFCRLNQWVKNSFVFNACDTFMCAPSFANPYGRAADVIDPCMKCTEEGAAPYFGSLTCDTPPNERQILTKVYSDLGGSRWKRNDYWLSKASVCDWYGVACNNGHVFMINLQNNQLNGTVPSEIFSMPELQLLWLGSNDIDVEFDDIELAKNLLDLRLDSSNVKSLRGLGNSKTITALSLAHLRLGGTFPADLFQLENIRYLNLTGNEFTGEIPSSFAKLRYLRVLELSDNLFTGQIPDFSDSSNLMDLRLARNHITSIPASLCERSDWNGGDVGLFGCDGILCQPGTSSKQGRSSEKDLCLPCPQADNVHFGQSLCSRSHASSSLASFSWSGMQLLLSSVLLWILQQ